MTGRAVSLIAAALVALLAFVCGPASAQESSGGLVATPVNSSVSCLDTSAITAKLTYPSKPLAAGTGATVRARMTFESASAAPRVEVFFNSAGEEFATVVSEYVARYRLPCFAKASGPQVMMQEFVFEPTGAQAVYPSEVWPDLRPIASCIEVSTKMPHGLLAGTVLLQMTFTTPLDAPGVRVLYNSGPDWLAGAFVEYASGYRARCMDASAGPIQVQQVFRARFEGDAIYAFQGMTLQQFLRNVESYKRPDVWFDTATMGCPFDLRFTPYQPYAENSVAQIERADPNRRGFIEWIRSLSLKLPPKAAPQLIGVPFLISVPCAVVKLP